MKAGRNALCVAGQTVGRRKRTAEDIAEQIALRLICVARRGRCLGLESQVQQPRLLRIAEFEFPMVHLAGHNMPPHCTRPKCTSTFVASILTTQHLLRSRRSTGKEFDKLAKFRFHIGIAGNNSLQVAAQQGPESSFDVLDHVRGLRRVRDTVSAADFAHCRGPVSLWIEEPIVEDVPVRLFATLPAFGFEFGQDLLEQFIGPSPVELPFGVTGPTLILLAVIKGRMDLLGTMDAYRVVADRSQEKVAESPSAPICLLDEILAQHLIGEETLHEVFGLLVAESHGSQIAVDWLPVAPA